jgi:hypothetical protein
MKKITLSALTALLLAACADHELPQGPTPVRLADHSSTPALMKKMPGFESTELYSLFGSDDRFAGSNFVFGGSADGAGLLKNVDGTFTLLVNHEDNFAVSRLTLDQTFKPTKGEYVLDSDGGIWRLCSATMATPKEHGFGPVFLTSGESGEESRTHGLNPYADASQRSTSRELAALGRTNAENAVPLPKTAFADKTAIIIGDDDSGQYGGQVYLYWADRGDLQNGELFVLRRKDLNQRERDITVGSKYEVEFVKVPNHQTLTGRQQNMVSDVDLKSIKFGRVEDLDYAKDGVGREIYFNVTGQDNTGQNADYSRTKYGRVYKLTLNATDPTKGEIEVLLDGDDRTGKAGKFQNPDNIVVTKNYVYIQEDPNSYGDETHDAYIYQYDIKTGALKVAYELDHRRLAADAAKYNVGGTSRFGSWEYGALIDVSEELGIPDTFVLCIQPHTWRGEAYRGVDGGSKRPNENQASQLVVIKGLPR